MNKQIRILFFSMVALLASAAATAQCSICTKTAAQMGEDAGRGLNAGILYLAAAPMLVVGYIAYRWWKNNS